MAMSKNRHAVALGRLGGKGGKGSPKRKAAAIKANKVRWQHKEPCEALSKQSQCQPPETAENK